MQSKIMHCKMLPRLERWFCQLSVDGKVSEPRARTIEKNQHSRKQEIGWNIETFRLGPRRAHQFHVIPAQAGTQLHVIPAQAGSQLHVIPAQAGTHNAMKQPVVYILASQRNGTLYIGVTSDLAQRIWQHKNDVFEGFTKKYGVHLLVYYEQHEDMENAIIREKRLKKWNREWKIRLIEENNPNWNDLYDSLL